MSDHMKLEDLEAVFNWNAEFSTAFRDIRAEGIAKSPLLKVIEALSPVASHEAVNRPCEQGQIKQELCHEQLIWPFSRLWVK
jgi:hypothetical protein